MATQETQSTSTQKARAPQSSNEADVREVIDCYIEAFRSAKLDDLLALYTPDVVAFDLVPPLQFNGRDAYRKSWEKALSMMQAPWFYDPKDLKICAGSDVAFAHALSDVGGTNKEGKKESGWLRHTLGLRKVNGKWLIAHEQMSVPIDMESGKGLMNLSPSTH